MEYSQNIILNIITKWYKREKGSSESDDWKQSAKYIVTMNGQS